MNFQLVFLRKPEQLRGLGKGWRAIQAHRQTRNRLAHGLGTVNPIELRVMTGELIHLLSDTTWIEQTPLPKTLGDPDSRHVEIGPVMNQLKRSATNGHSVQQLACKFRHLRKSQ